MRQRCVPDCRIGAGRFVVEVSAADERRATNTGDASEMHYIVSVIADGTESASPGEEAAIDTFNEQLQNQGHWVYANGLADPNSATVIDGRGDVPIFTDGPFLESKEFLAGFWIIDAPNLDVALKLASAGSKACNRKVELRPMHA